MKLVRNSFELFLIFLYIVSMSILGIGQSVYDMVLPVDHIPENEKIRIYHSVSCMGGPVSCAMYVCGKWHADTHIMTRIGNDVWGKEIIKTLQEVNIDVSSMVIDPSITTSQSHILVFPSGDRTILNVPIQKESSMEPMWPDQVDVILMDGHEVEWCKEAMKRYPSAITILDGDKYKPETENLIHQVDYLICSQQFTNMLDIHSYHQLVALNPSSIWTQGSKGCIYQNQVYPSYPCKVMDTTGAGDVFHGAFAYGMDSGFDIPSCIRISNMAAAMVCEGLGGVLSVPTWESVNERLSICEKNRK